MSRKTHVYNNGKPRTGVPSGLKSARRKSTPKNYARMCIAAGRGN